MNGGMLFSQKGKEEIPCGRANSAHSLTLFKLLWLCIRKKIVLRNAFLVNMGVPVFKDIKGVENDVCFHLNLVFTWIKVPFNRQSIPFTIAWTRSHTPDRFLFPAQRMPLHCPQASYVDPLVLHWSPCPPGREERRGKKKGEWIKTRHAFNPQASERSQLSQCDNYKTCF